MTNVSLIAQISLSLIHFERNPSSSKLLETITKEKESTNSGYFFHLGIFLNKSKTASPWTPSRTGCTQLICFSLDNKQPMLLGLIAVWQFQHTNFSSSFHLFHLHGSLEKHQNPFPVLYFSPLYWRFFFNSSHWVTVVNYYKCCFDYNSTQTILQESNISGIGFISPNSLYFGVQAYILG